MKIVQQINEQECGICVLTALHNHLYHHYISKEQILEQSNVVENGMSIFDFESVGQKLGLECESYELNYAEFSNLKINNYFVLLLATQESNSHYVIARKRKKYIELYDSSNSKMSKISYTDLQKVFMNVIILIRKKANKVFNKTFSNASTLLLFDLKFILLNTSLSILILMLSVISASFLNYIIDLAVLKSSLTNLITICFIFIFFYLANDILSYISNLYMTRNVKNNLVLFTSKILSSLETKKANFLNKVDKNWIYKVDECVYNVANFCIVEVNKLITNIIFLAVCICIIGSIQYYLLIFVFLYAIVDFIFFLFSYQKKKDIFIKIVRSENTNIHQYRNLINSLSNELWQTKRKSIIQRIKSNYSNIYKNYSDSILFKNNSYVFKSMLKSIFEICAIGLMSYLIIKHNSLSIGRLTFVISAFALYKNSVDGTFEYFLIQIEFKVYWQVYKDITHVGNVDNSRTIVLKEKIKSISFVCSNKQIEFKALKTNHIFKDTIDLIKDCNKLVVNKRSIKMNKQIWESIIVFDQRAKPDISLLMYQIEIKPELYSQYIRYFNIDLNKANPTFYENLIINFLNLLSEKQKLIFIDDILQYIKSKDMIIIKQIINHIKKHNVVFINEKEEHD